MKKILLALVLLTFLIQNSCIVDQNKYKETDIFEEFETQRGFTILHLPPVLFKIIFSLSNDNEQETPVNAKQLLDKVEVIKLMFFEEAENTMQLADLKLKINDNIKGFEYKLLTRIAEENNDISIYIIDKEKVINEVLILIESDKEYIGLNLIGQLTKEEVFKLYKMINMQSVQNFDN